MRVSVIVPGPPVPKERPRVVRGRTYTPPRTREYEARVGRACAAALPRGWQRHGRYAVEIHIIEQDRRERDLDNIAKSILDGLNEIAWVDDCQVDHLSITRIRPDRKRASAIIDIILIEEEET